MAKLIETETLNDLIENPWSDAAEINYGEIIPRGTEVVEIYLLTGTFGHATYGHARTIERIQEFIKHQDQIDKDRKERGESVPRKTRLLLILPLTKTRGVEGYTKKEAQIAPIETRLKSLLLQILKTYSHETKSISVALTYN